MIINMIYENQSSVAVACFLPGRAKDLSARLYDQIPHDAPTIIQLQIRHIGAGTA